MFAIFPPHSSQLRPHSPSRQRATKASLCTATAEGRPIEACKAAALIKSLQVPLLRGRSRESNASSSVKSTHPSLSPRAASRGAVVTGRPQGLQGIRETTCPASSPVAASRQSSGRPSVCRHSILGGGLEMSAGGGGEGTALGERGQPWGRGSRAQKPLGRSRARWADGTVQGLPQVAACPPRC